MRIYNHVLGVVLFISLFFFFTPTFADEVTCYSHGTKIYQGIVRDAVYNENLNVLWFVEPKSKSFVFIEGMDCIVKQKLR
jgi:hypothetical protein